MGNKHARIRNSRESDPNIRGTESTTADSANFSRRKIGWKEKSKLF